MPSDTATPATADPTLPRDLDRLAREWIEALLTHGERVSSSDHAASENKPQNS